MNIVEAYIKFNEELIILLSGLSGSGKTKIASFVERDFKIKKINIEDYCVSENDKVVQLTDEVKVRDWDHIDSYNWKKINEDVNKYKTAGVIVCGPYFPKDKLEFTNYFHIQLKISKQKLIEKRHNFIKENPEKCKDIIKYLDTPIESLIINKITYPHFLDYASPEKSKIDKYVNTKNPETNIDLTEDQIYDQVADYLFYKIKDYLGTYNKKTNKFESVSESSHKTNKTNNFEEDDTSNSETQSEYLLGTTYDEEEELKYVNPSRKTVF